MYKGITHNIKKGEVNFICTWPCDKIAGLKKVCYSMYIYITNTIWISFALCKTNFHNSCINYEYNNAYLNSNNTSIV